jgi:hypothetical protein
MSSIFKPICAVLCLIFALLVAPNAYADSFTPTFTCTGTCVEPLPTTPDVSFPTADLAVAVTWDSTLFSTLHIPQSPQPTDSFTWVGIVSPGIIDFEIHDLTNGAGSSQGVLCPSCTTSFRDAGAFTL